MPMSAAVSVTFADVPRSPAGLQRAARVAAWTLLILAVAFSFGGTVGKSDCQDMDFGSYYRAGRAAARGETPYTIDEHGPLGAYSYAPAYAYAFMPLACLDYLWACRLWMVVNWTATAAAALLALRLVRGPRQAGERAWPLVFLAVLPVGGYLWANLHMGQVAMLMVLGCLGWAWCQRRGARFTGGLVLAAACALKLAPGVLLPYLFLRRDLRGLAGVLVGAAGLFVFPAAWVGWDGTLRLHREWVCQTAATQIPAQTCRRGNQSLLAQLARLPAISDGDVCIAPETLAQLERVYPVLVLALAAALYGWIVVTLRRPGSAADRGQRENVVLALLLLFLTLVHPRAWRCNFVALLLPCVFLVERARQRLPGWRAGLVALGLVLVACLWPTRGFEDGWTFPGWLLLGKHFWGAVAVAAACGRCAALRQGISSANLQSAARAGPAGAARPSSAWYVPGCRRGTRPSGSASRRAERIFPPG
jgi:Glycosyltransferase family 87